MIRFFLDTEFNGWNGEMLSLALVRDDGASIYLRETNEFLHSLDQSGRLDPWVRDNVCPLLDRHPFDVHTTVASSSEWAHTIGEFLYRDTSSPPQVFADWPSDIADLCKLLLTGPGEAVPMPHQTHFTILRHLDVYPTSLKEAVQHNAWWDAMALRRWFQETQS